MSRMEGNSIRRALEDAGQMYSEEKNNPTDVEVEALETVDSRDKSVIIIIAHAFIHKANQVQNPLKRDAKAKKQAIIAYLATGDKILTYNILEEIKNALHVS